MQTLETSFFPLNPDHAAPPLAELLALDDVSFTARFRGTPIERIGRKRLARNACIAAGNSHRADLIPKLQSVISDSSPLVRGHAGWALARLEGRAGVGALHEQLQTEIDLQVRLDWAASLEEIGASH